MRKIPSVLSLVLAATLGMIAVALPSSAAVVAPASGAGGSLAKCELHGGKAVTTAANRFEVLFTDQEARVYVYDEKQAPVVDLAALKATLTLETKGGKPAPAAMTVLEPDAAVGRTQGALVVRQDFKSVAKTPTKALFHIQGLGTQAADFSSPVVIGTQSIYVCPMDTDVTGEDPGKCSRCGMNLVKQDGAQTPEHSAAGAEKTGHQHP